MKRYLMLGLLVAGCGSKEAALPDPGAGKPVLSVSTSAFPAGGAIPARYTCDGADEMPALTWSDAPTGTKAYAVIVDDPDAPDPAAPKKTYVHFVAGFGSVDKGMPAASEVAGKNDDGNAKWNGPCPPTGRHRYFFKVYALDSDGLVTAGATKADVIGKITGHVLAKGELIGTYEKQAK
jgi:hypothetical protein